MFTKRRHARLLTQINEERKDTLQQVLCIYISIGCLFFFCNSMDSKKHVKKIIFSAARMYCAITKAVGNLGKTKASARNISDS